METWYDTLRRELATHHGLAEVKMSSATTMLIVPIRNLPERRRIWLGRSSKSIRNQLLQLHDIC